MEEEAKDASRMPAETEDGLEVETFLPKPPPYPPPQTVAHKNLEDGPVDSSNEAAASAAKEDNAISEVSKAAGREQMTGDTANVQSPSSHHPPGALQQQTLKETDKQTVQFSASAEAKDSAVDEQDVLDALLVAARDSVVSSSAGLALAKLALGKGARKLVARATSLLSDHSRSVTEHAIKESLPHRVSLYKIVASVLKEDALNNSHPQQQNQGAGIDHELASKFAELAVGDLTAINIAMMAAASGMPMGSEWELQRNASKTLVALAHTHADAVMTHLLPKLELASMFHQQQAQKRAQQMRGGLQEAQELVLILVLITLKDIATSFPEQLTLHFKAALGRLLPVMGMAVSSQVKEAWGSCITACCTAVRQHALEVRSACERADDGWKEGMHARHASM
jgi:hypothetical protein